MLSASEEDSRRILFSTPYPSASAEKLLSRALCSVRIKTSRPPPQNAQNAPDFPPFLGLPFLIRAEFGAAVYSASRLLQNWFYPPERESSPFRHIAGSPLSSYPKTASKNCPKRVPFPLRPIAPRRGKVGTIPFPPRRPHGVP